MNVDEIADRIMNRYNKVTDSKGLVLREDIVDYLSTIQGLPMEEKLDHLELFLGKFLFLTELDKIKITEDIASY